MFVATLLLAQSAHSDESQSGLGSSITISGQLYEAVLVSDDASAELLEVLPELVESANLELSRQLREDLRFSAESLIPLANYLNYLYPELDRGAPQTLLSVELGETQLDQLLNLYFELLEERLPSDTDRQSYLEGMGFDYTDYLARRLSEQLQQIGECYAVKQAGGNARLEIYESPEACAGGPTGQTIWVNKMQLADTDDVAMDREQVAEVLENGREEYMGDPEQGIVGYPVESLLGLAQTLGDVYAASGYSDTFSTETKLPLMQQLELTRRSRGISFDQLKSIALELQTYLRRQGYFLANAYIPRQDFQAGTGVVSVGVSFGTLGDVALLNEDNVRYSSDVLLDPFRDYMGEMVTRDIYSAYFAVNDLPGVRIRSGLFEPGDEPGETRLVLDVEEDRFRFSLATDNFGSDFTGAERAILAVDWYSPLGRGDSFSAGILQSINPADSTFGFANYSIPLFDIAHEIAFAWDTHEYDSIDSRLGSEVLIHGEVESLYLGYNYKWKRSKGLNVQFGLRAFQKQSDTSVQLAAGGNTQISNQETDVRGALISTGGDILLRSSRSIVGWQASLLYGEQPDASNFRIADEYTRFAVDSKAITVLPWGPGADISHLSVRFVGAYSGDILQSFEQTPLGGPFGVRAFKSYDFTADTLAFLNMEWRVDVGQHLFGSLSDQNTLRLGVFAEAGYGEANGFDIAADSTADMSAYGLLLSYRWRENFSVETSLAFPGHSSSSDDFTNDFTDDDYNFLFDVRYIFY